MSRVCVYGSPWESDVVMVTRAYYWHEYEIKLSLGDFRRDFYKQIDNFSRRESQTKHQVYTSHVQIARPRHGEVIPRPKSFSFVVPMGLLDNVDVPSHCGIVEYGEELGYWHLQIKRPAPAMPNPTKLNQLQIFNLARKASWRLAVLKGQGNG